MQILGIHMLPVFLAAVATMVVGFLWYSPMLFARPWMRAMGYDPDDKAKLAEMKKGAGGMYALAFLASMVAAAMLSKIVEVTTVNSARYGMKVGLGMWVGFVMTVQLTDHVFTRKPARLFLINTGYQMVCYAVMGAIVAVMNR